jgi:hypothetical protein
MNAPARKGVSLIATLYFFAGKAVVVLSHGLTKEREVPPREIDQAVERKQMVEADFEKFTFRPE